MCCRGADLLAWTTGGNVEQLGKARLFKEVVALANTSGGHLILGIAETKDKPPAADKVTPVSHCLELAERLERAAQSIDPPIPLLGVRGVPTEPDGAGVVVFRVPQSRSAPHRSVDKECYTRRGTEFGANDHARNSRHDHSCWASDRSQRMVWRGKADVPDWKGLRSGAPLPPDSAPGAGLQGRACARAEAINAAGRTVFRDGRRLSLFRQPGLAQRLGQHHQARLIGG